MLVSGVAYGSAGTTTMSLGTHDAAALNAASSSHPLWPLSICAKQSGSRFTTTTVGGDDHGLFEGYVGEPAAAHVHPKISAHRAFRNFHKVYGPTTAAEDRHTQIRFGLTNDLDGGEASKNEIGFVPTVRRTHGWIISNCADAPSPRDYGGHFVGGTVLAIIADTRAPKTLGFIFLPKHPTMTNPGEQGGPATQHPAAGSTPFYSTPWRVAAHRKGGKILLRYHPRHCFTFDHVNLDGAPPRATSVSVILSSGPKGRCPKPSATSPYVEIMPGPHERFTTLRHERTGKARFEPESD
jgi:hypothetical protein